MNRNENRFILEKHKMNKKKQMKRKGGAADGIKTKQITLFNV